MAGWRQAVELAMTGEEIETLTALSLVEGPMPASRVFCGWSMLLGYCRVESRRSLRRGPQT